ncbi:mannitol dehydrogenase family protein [Neorhizobium sp. NCHU2750]|uniref:mannitol dehydrogenase family protein n=1 Tax=Neorhizobium sp. NCHU2750 TaxID=1825976 RepID=UPI000E717401|nr:mannitol dehydrogenase [Neorhizobium sp. NCHU2750]
MTRLSRSTPLPQGVERPSFDPGNLKVGIVHLGLGAFHRAHQAIYTDKAIEARSGDWGIASASLRSVDIVADLKAQDYRYSVVTRSGSGDKARIVGSIIDAIAASEERERLLQRLTDNPTRVVTLTVSEKAYGIDPVSGGLDLSHPAISHDLAHPTAPIGVIGMVVEALARRMHLGRDPLTVLCCDNLPGNGNIVRRLVLEMADRRDAGLAAWIEREIRFPSSMVDRIVPAATDQTRTLAASLIGAEDHLALETEPFSQWVIEDDFAAGRPAWEAGGAIFVSDVHAYEKMKLRLLNGSHSLIAYLGQLNGLEYVRDVMGVPVHAGRVRQHMEAVLPTLDPVPEIDLSAYREELVARFSNPAIAHRTGQIAMDGTQKMPQRIFAPAAERLAAGGDAADFAEVVAFWLAYVITAKHLDDPRAAELKVAAALASTSVSSAPFFGIPGLFPPELKDNATWRQFVDAHLRRLCPA